MITPLRTRNRSAYQAIAWVSFAVAMSFCSFEARAGLYAGVGASWNNFVFEPVAEEDTPNYFGYGGRASVGYSAANILDLGIYGHYTPGRLGTPAPSPEDARLWHGGGELGLRLGNAVYLGARGGPALYRLNSQTKDEEVPGQWTGTMFQGSAGLIVPVNRYFQCQTTLDIGQASLRPSSTDGADRTLTEISVTISFVYNYYQSTARETALFKNWIRNVYK